MSFQTWKCDDSNSIDFVVSADCFKQDNLFLSLCIWHELKYNAIFKIDRTSPRTGQVSFKFMSVKQGMICIFIEKFQCIFNLVRENQACVLWIA